MPDHSCLPFTTTGALGNFLMVLQLSVNFIIPFIIISTMNIRILMCLRQNRAALEDISNHRSNTALEDQLTRILLGIGIAFLFLVTPFYAWEITYKFVDFTESPLRISIYAFYFQAACQLLYTNNALNFAFYIIDGRKIRRDVMNIFKCQRED